LRLNEAWDDWEPVWSNAAATRYTRATLDRGKRICTTAYRANKSRDGTRVLYAFQDDADAPYEWQAGQVTDIVHVQGPEGGPDDQQLSVTFVLVRQYLKIPPSRDGVADKLADVLVTSFDVNAERAGERVLPLDRVAYGANTHEQDVVAGPGETRKMLTFVPVLGTSHLQRLLLRVRGAQADAQAGAQEGARRRVRARAPSPSR
jgi:hypothetical protein